MMNNNRKTVTSEFGVSGRVNHDSTKFYSSRLYDDLGEIPKPSDYEENIIDPKILNKIFCKSSEQMDEIPNDSVHLMITSPPYNVGKEYDKDMSLSEYLKLLETVFSDVYRVLIWGGRACINVANLGRRPYLPLHSFIINIMLDIGFLMRGEVIWDKGSSSGSSTAWGSWLSATNPILRDTHEYILIFSKGSFGRSKIADQKSTMSKSEFLEFTKSIWKFPAESAQRVNHPAPFPVELPYRLIQFYSFRKDIILDPFCGSGTTCVVSKKTQRQFIGYDIDEQYVIQSRNRLKQFEMSFERTQNQRRTI